MPEQRADASAASSLLWCRGASGVLALALIAMGAGVLIGWQFGIEELKSVLAGRVAMNPLTAVLFILSAVCAWQLARPELDARGLRVALGVAAVVLAASGLRAVGYALGWEPGLDRVLFSDRLHTHGQVPNRMAPHTAAAFLCCGAALTLLTHGSFRSIVAAIVLVTNGALLGALALVGHANGVVAAFGVTASIGMAVHTSAGLIVLSALIVHAAWIRLSSLRDPAGASRSGGRDADRLNDRLVVVGVTVAIGIMTVVGATAFASIRNFREHDRWTGHTHEVLAAASGLALELKSLESGVRNWLLSPEEAGYPSFESDAARLESHREALRGLTADSREQQERLEALAPLMERWIAGMRRAVELRRREGPGAATRELASGEEHRTMERVLGAIRAIHGHEQALLQRRSAAADAGASATVAIVCAGSLSGIVIVGLFGYQVRRDMVRRRAAEGALRDTERNLRLAIEAGKIGTWRWDLDHDTVDMSERARDLLGGPADGGASASAYRSALHPEDADRVMSAVRHAIETLSEYDIEYRCIQRDGSIRWVSARGRPQLGNDGRPVSMQGVVLDITDRYEADELRRASLEQERAHADASNRAKGEFLAHMSHEIRTPLNGVAGMMDLLLGTALNDQQRYFCRLARTSTDALTTVINDILDFSKIEAGKLEVVREEYEFRRTVEDAVEMLGQLAAQKGLELVCHVHPDVPSRAFGDCDRLRQVLINLVGNAIKFTERGGVVVRAVPGVGGVDTQTVRFEISDTGIGIHPEKIERLFKAFSQADPSTTRTHGGTGLGLAISKRLVDMMGGEIGVESQAGRGSTFWFTTTLGVSRGSGATAPRGWSDPRELRVLTVDDSELQRQALGEQLMSWGLRPAAASSGAEALEMLSVAAAARSPFRVAIVDRDMPSMGGFELARVIKSRSEIADTVLMILLSQGGVVDHAELAAMGFAGQLTKPVRQSQLFDAIMEAIAVGGGAAGARRAVALPVVPEATAPARSSGVRILVAEDNEVNQIVVRELLTKSGYQCDVVDNGEKAVRALSSARYDLVLMDCQMPVLDGFDATRTIRAAEAGRTRVPIVALTANAMKGDRERCLEAGMDAYASKPIKPGELLATIAALVGERVTRKDAA